MALPVLDGNQTATTLSSVVTGGEHIVAHSVVSLGANAIANITSAVSGSVVSVSNFPASQSTTFGAVTGSVSILNFPSTQTIAGTVTASLSESLLYPNGATGLTKGIAVGFLESQTANPPEFTIPNTDGSRPFPVAIVLNDGAGYANAVGSDMGSSSLPISGTVTANVFFPEAAFSASNIASDDGGVVPDFGVQIGFTDGTEFKHVSPSVALPVSGTVTIGNSVTIGSLPAISGTVTVGNSITIGSFATSVTARLINPAGTAVTYAEVGTAGSPSIDVLSVQGVSGGTSLPISGTAGALTTRFGTPTTANTAFATTAVTNTSRRYLLIQNVTTGSNVITVGIGFTPTTTQGIQLTAGAGITFESSHIPTGQVFVLSSVTASNFTILEA